MIKKTIKRCIILIVVLFSCANIAHASLQIAQVMYDPEGTDTDREWVKLYNNGEEEINIIGGKTNAAWRISGGEKEESLHYINENLDIPAHGYAVIAKNKDNFNQEYSSFSGPVTTASISLNNTSGIVKIWDGLNPRRVIASLPYNKNDSTNDLSSDSSDNTTTDTEDSDSSSTSSSSSSSEVVSAVLKITTKIISPKIVVEGIPFSLSSLTTTNRGETYAVGKFVWNFGDGMKSEVRKSSPFNYIYDYPGEYVLALSYFDNSFNEIADATDRLIIKVIPSDVYISSVGNDIDPYIELENKSKYEVVLSDWIITGGEHSFVFPSGTTIMQGNKIKLSPKITGFTGGDLKYVVVTNPNKEIITTYPIEKKKIIYKSSPISSVVYNDSNITTSNTKDIPLLEDSQVINLNDLSASVEDAKINVSNSAYPFIGLLVIIVLGIVSFLFIKKKNKTKDYVENEIRPEDMTIIE